MTTSTAAPPPRAGVRHLLAAGFQRALIVPADVPFLDPSEVDALLERAKRAGTAVSIVPDRHSRGTNGLLLHPPDAVPPAFGAGSCARHRALAMAAGASSRVEPLPSLALDVDTAADLDALVERLDARPGRAWATRRVVPSWPPEARRRGGQTTA